MVVGLSSMSPLVQLAVVVVVTTLVVQLVRWLLSYRSFFNFYNNLPGETDFSWVWGNLHKIRRKKTEKLLEYFTAMARKHPRFYRLWPQTVDLPNVVTVVGDGLLVADGAKWARSRRLLTPAFHFDILKPYVAVSNAACDVMLRKLKRHADEKKSIEMFGMISLCTLDIIMQCAMSYKDDIQEKGDSHPYVQAVTDLTNLNVERNRNPLVHWDFVFYMTPNGRRWKTLCDTAHAVSERVINARKDKLEKEGPPQKRYLDFLDILLTAKDDSGQGMTSLEIRNEVDTFMFEGHDTTASAISWTLYSLCKNPEYQQRVQTEVDHILQGRQSDDIRWEDLSKFELLTMVLKEVMRMHPPVPVISRRLVEPLQLGDTTIAPGNDVSVHIYNLHHNPAVWSDPWSFRPERFHPDNMQGMDHYAFLPFSAGPRNCIGQHFAMNEEKVVVARLLRK
nr:hypothetical protein BaRGS_013681 [Batillaria attramentaria]